LLAGPSCGDGALRAPESSGESVLAGDGASFFTAGVIVVAFAGTPFGAWGGADDSGFLVSIFFSFGLGAWESLAAEVCPVAPTDRAGARGG
jgi:hypothetical protein